jgi:2,4-dienoyl-CoA reductase-like NADH-dependent reductase (Old Yellow Enzyme family)
MSSPKYSHLLAPGRMGPLVLRNRIVMPGMDQNACTDHGLITDDEIAHYEERARGEVGLLILGASAVAYPIGATSRHQPALSTDECLPGLRRLAEAVHRHGASMIVQMVHHGKVARVDTMDGRDQLVAAVPLPQYRPELENITPHELTGLIAANGSRRATHRAASADDLDEVVDAFTSAARRIQQAGLDGVEIHAGHGYLISTFLSPLYNTREDDYGGSVEKRAHLLARILKAVRAACGPEFAVVVRLDGEEFGDDGITPELAVKHAQIAEAAGADAIHVSAASLNSMSYAFTDGPLPWQPGQYVELARRIKTSISIPVIAVGRISPELGDELLVRGDTCDFVSMGRQLLADPEIPARLKEGRPDLVRTCINCFVCVAENFWDARPVCAVNTRLGHYECQIGPSSTRRRVMVVGGGPAGMEAARVAANRGHEVQLVERNRLGGTVRLSSLTTPANADLVRYLSTAIREAGVEIVLGRTMDTADIQAEVPDAVIVATGARRSRPAIRGGDLPHVLSGDDLRDLLTGSHNGQGFSRSARFAIGAARRVGLLNDPARMRTLSHRWLPLGERIAVIGGGLVGVELAAFLAERGRTVTLLEDSPYLGAEMALPRRMRAVHELSTLGVKAERESVVIEINKDSVIYNRNNEHHRVPADHVIYAAGVEPDTSLADALKASGLETYAVGDCAQVGYIRGAIHSGAEAASRI